MDFALDSLFPASFRPGLAPIFNIVFKIVVLLGCFKQYVVQSENLNASESSPFASDDFAGIAIILAVLENQSSNRVRGQEEKDRIASD